MHTAKICYPVCGLCGLPSVCYSTSAFAPAAVMQELVTRTNGTCVHMHRSNYAVRVCTSTCTVSKSQVTALIA